MNLVNYLKSVHVWWYVDVYFREAWFLSNFAKVRYPEKDNVTIKWELQLLGIVNTSRRMYNNAFWFRCTRGGGASFSLLQDTGDLPLPLWWRRYRGESHQNHHKTGNPGRHAQQGGSLWFPSNQTGSYCKSKYFHQLKCHAFMCLSAKWKIYLSIVQEYWRQQSKWY